jgi:hypothetical protein
MGHFAPSMCTGNAVCRYVIGPSRDRQDRGADTGEPSVPADSFRRRERARTGIYPGGLVVCYRIAFSSARRKSRPAAAYAHPHERNCQSKAGELEGTPMRRGHPRLTGPHFVAPPIPCGRPGYAARPPRGQSLTRGARDKRIRSRSTARRPHPPID